MVRAFGLAVVLVVMATWGQPGWSRQDDSRLDDLFARLQTASAPSVVEEVESEIWRIWLETGDAALDLLMERGVRAMSGGDYQVALVAFNALIENAPDFAEGWNKRATLYWLMGVYDKSVEDIDHTLELEPRHFGALSGLALIRTAQGRPEDALKALERIHTFHPRMRGLEFRLRELRRKLGEPV